LKKKLKLGVSIWTGMGVRNICYTGLLEALIQNFHVVMFSPYDCVGYKKKKIDQVSIKRGKFSEFIHKVLYMANYYALWLKHRPETLNKYISRDQKEKYIKYVLFKMLSWCVLKVRSNKTFDFIRDLAYHNSAHIFAGIEVLFVTSTDSREDQYLMYGAKKVGLPVIALVHSWDNLPARGLLSVKPDALLVWNEIMKEQAITLHGMDSSDVFVIGVPQYQYYKKMACILNRQKFYEKYLEYNNKKDVVLYTCSAERVFPDEELFINALIQELNKFHNIQFVIRLHPEERKEQYLDQFSERNDIVISNPDDSFRATKTDSIGDVESVADFIELIKYSSVVINMASTITLDAVLFDTPVICPMFNIAHDSGSWNAANNWYVSSHFKTIVESDAVELPLSMDELISCMDNAIKNPDYKSNQRNSLRKIMSPDVDSVQVTRNVIQQVSL